MSGLQQSGRTDTAYWELFWWYSLLKPTPTQTHRILATVFMQNKNPYRF